MTERPSITVRGPWVVVATLSLFFIVPAFVVLSIRLLPDQHDSSEETSTDPAASPLVWAERDQWPHSMRTTFKSLERGMMSAARNNETYKDFGFHVEPEEEAAVVRCSVLARDLDAFVLPATRDQLNEEIAQRPDFFYAYYLLGSWHRFHNEESAADEAFSKAFQYAPAAIIQRFTQPDLSPVVEAPLPPTAIAADQVINDTLNRDVVLVFPYPRTDDRGFVYLPVYKTILRMADPYAQPGFEPAQQKPGWFTFYGRVGRLADAIQH